jgi:hypothetical protein
MPLLKQRTAFISGPVVLVLLRVADLPLTVLYGALSHIHSYSPFKPSSNFHQSHIFITFRKTGLPLVISCKAWQWALSLAIIRKELAKIVTFINRLQQSVTSMDEGRRGCNTSRRGGLPTLPGLYLSTFQPSHRGFFRVRLCEGRECLSPNFQTFQDPRHQFQWGEVWIAGKYFSRICNWACTLKNPCCGGRKISWGRLLLNILLGDKYQKVDILKHSWVILVKGKK